MKVLVIWLVSLLFIVMGSSCVSGLQNSSTATTRDRIAVNSSSASSPDPQTENIMPQDLISAEVQPLPNQANPAALAMQRLGFRILHIGPTISVQAPRSLWEITFNVSFEEATKPSITEIGSESTYLQAITDDLVIPTELEGLIADVMFVEPPEFY